MDKIFATTILCLWRILIYNLYTSSGCGCITKLDEKQVAEYYNRCYKSVDGLWFMKVEEKDGFNAALTVDNEVWKVMPKIQARMIKSFLGLGTGADALFEGVVTKLELDGFKFTAQKTVNGFRVTVTDCPWLNLMTKSGRRHLAKAVGTIVCNTEYNDGFLSLQTQ